MHCAALAYVWRLSYALKDTLRGTLDKFGTCRTGKGNSCFFILHNHLQYTWSFWWERWLLLRKRIRLILDQFLFRLENENSSSSKTFNENKATVFNFSFLHTGWGDVMLRCSVLLFNIVIFNYIKLIVSNVLQRP